MNRKNFLTATVAAMPLFSLLPKFAQAANTTKPIVVSKGKSRYNDRVQLGPNTNDLKISQKDTGNQISIFEYTGYEKSGPPLHVHFEQDEIFYVLEGSYRFVAGDEKMDLTAGDTIFLPRNLPHTWLQLTNQGRMLYGVQPAGSMEAFFQKLGSLKQPPSPEEAQQLHIAHGMKIIGPPLTL